MLLSDFTTSGFYYNHGQDLLVVGDIIEESRDKHYKVILTNQNEVWVEEGETHELKDPKDLGRDFFHECYPPLDPGHIPQFSF